jgi:hypothetical protein
VHELKRRVVITARSICQPISNAISELMLHKGLHTSAPFHLEQVKAAREAEIA